MNVINLTYKFKRKKENIKYYKKISRPIIKKSNLKKINTKNDLMRYLIKYYNNYSSEELELKKIDLQNEINQIREGSFFAKISVFITIFISVATFSINIVNTEYVQKRNNHEVKINSLENKKEAYHEKLLEVQNKIKFTTDTNEKRRLQDYEKTIKKEIIYKSKDISMNFDNLVKIINYNNNYINKPIKGMLYLLIILYICAFIEERANIKEYRKKQYLIMNLDIMNLLDNTTKVNKFIG
ncbi:hypothetical protein [Clostridium sporogenes]|uniref:Uncharacterized protein n=1 Tax=Clostridium sporogenes TaxID=1509 RepID=A0AAE6LWH6_CLOSG|nr:hypothetical protein [Clostridium sporogenes]QDY32685.1 hypothetical protein CGS26_10080 [Clostridium sporogenes]